MSQWPDRVKIETRKGHSGGPQFQHREDGRSGPYYAGQELETYVRLATLTEPEKQLAELRSLIKDEVSYLRAMNPEPKHIARRLEDGVIDIAANHPAPEEPLRFSLADLTYAIGKAEAEGFKWKELEDEDVKKRLEQAAFYNDPPLDERDKHLKPCDRCEEHVGIGEYDDNWGFTPPEERSPVQRVCLWCASKVSIFNQGQPRFEEVVRQRAADMHAGYAPREWPTD